MSLPGCQVSISAKPTAGPQLACAMHRSSSRIVRATDARERLKRQIGQWPICAGYGKIWSETNLALICLSPDERDRILGGAAIAFYRLSISVAARAWTRT